MFTPRVYFSGSECEDAEIEEFALFYLGFGESGEMNKVNKKWGISINNLLKSKLQLLSLVCSFWFQKIIVAGRAPCFGQRKLSTIEYLPLMGLNQR